MMKIICLVIVAMLAAGVSADFTDCQNGHYCPSNMACTSTAQGAGARWGCAVSGNICSDTRFACPTDFQCSDDTTVCTSADGETMEPIETMTAKTEAQAFNLRSDPTTEICDVLDPVLPSWCSCTPSGSNYGAALNCDVNFLGIEHFTLDADVEPCVDPASVDIAITDTLLSIDWSYDLVLGYDGEIEIPGLEVNIPLIGDAQLELDLKLSGDIAEMHLAIGIDACVTKDDSTKCGEDLYKGLPIWVLDHTFNFDSVCGDGN